MSKIICDICGTSYQDTAECCPICGCSKDSAADLLADEVLNEEVVEETKGNPAADFSKKKQIFDYDEANSQRKEESVDTDDEETFDDEEEEEEDRPRRNVFVVILLTILIAALLLAAGFIVVRYVLPNMGGDEETTPVVTETQQAQTEATELRVACETLVLQSGSMADLSEVGFSHLVNVLVIPENTTDTVTFESADQSVATVTEDGKITAVGEGETVVTITCGDVQAYVNVVCDFTPEETTEETAAATEEVESTEETTDETTAETEGNQEIDSNVQLKLQKNDIRLGVYYQFQLVLDCELEPTDVEWSSEHPHIATVDEMGNVTAVKSGTTAIIAKYGEQQVQCIVRCF